MNTAGENIIMTDFNTNLMEKRKEQITIKYHREMSNLYNTELHKIFQWFVKKFPKHHLKWYSRMGSNFWELDGEILDWNTADLKYTKGCWSTYYVDAVPDRKAKVLKPLWDFYQSVNDVTNCVSDDWIQTMELNSNDYKFDPHFNPFN